ncbi:MAG: tetratricopeptide repeat protein, partial [Ignavibacteria bacterium]
VLSEEIPHFKTYNYQLLFKKFLVSKFYETSSKSKINSLLKKAFRYYKSQNEIVPALNYLLLTGDLRTAVPLIIKNFQRLYDEGKYEILWRWLSSIDGEFIDKNYYLLYYRNLLQKFFIRDAEGSLPYLEKAIRLLEKGKNNQFLIDCYISRADTLLSLGKTEDAIKNLQKLVDKKISIEKKAKLLYFLALSYYKISKYDETSKLLFKSLDLCKQKNLKDVYTDVYVLLGKIYLIMGEYTKSTFYYEQIVDRAFDVKSKFEIISNLVLLYSQSDNYEKARECLDKTRELRILFPIPIFNIAYLIAKQAYLYEYGDYEENIRILEEFNSIAIKLNHKYYIYLSYSLLSDSYYFLNKLTKAEEYYELAGDYLDKRNEHERIEYD